MDSSSNDPSSDLPSGSDTDSRLRHMASQGLTPSRAVGSHGGPAWEPPTPEELQLEIGTYKVLEILGRGGMGAVYKGWQVSLERYVAIKILPPDIDDGDAHFADRFKQESKTMAKFLHPGIVAVFDAGETASGLLYIVMEFVEGTDVSQMLLRKGKLDPINALAITAHVCDALHYAHTRGVVHRDIKPANIMVNNEGVVKVADFGLAKASGAAQMGLTRTDMSMGTPDFIAPEALTLGVIADHRADLYAVGVMLYNMLTGEIPRGRFKPASEKVRSDPRFDAIVDRAMEQDREHRYQSSQEIRRDLDVILSTPMEKQAEAPVAARSSPAQKPVRSPALRPNPKEDKGPVAQNAVPDGLKAGLPARKKSGNGMMAGIIGSVAVIGLGAFMVLKKPDTKTEASPLLANAAKDAPFVNSLGMKFVPVPGTKVLFSIWSTRVADYAAYAKERNPEDFWQKQLHGGVPVSREPEYPVVGVNWNDAQSFCQWLTERDTSAGKLPEGARYRLPTDEEWSIAVGLPTETGATPEEKAKNNSVDFPWGKGFPPKQKVGNYADETFRAKFIPTKLGGNGWIEGYTDGYATTSPVGSFPANQFGLYDMGGNANNWCEDWVDESKTSRVLRGETFATSNRKYILSAFRYAQRPLSHGHAAGFSGGPGFRCVLELGASSVVSAPVVQPSTPPPPYEAGFRSLFDGKTLAGWSDYKQPELTTIWGIEKGAIVRLVSGSTLLVTSEVFTDFDLRLEWKVGPKGDGGIFFRVLPAEGNTTGGAPEFQLCARDVDNEFKSGSINSGKKGTTPLRKLADIDATLPTGEWNTARLVVNGGHCEHWVNEKLVCSYDIGSDQYFGQHNKGMIGLQSFAGKVFYRNIRIRPPDGKGKPASP